MRDFNAWANELRTSYATEKNARIAMDKKIAMIDTGMSPVTGSHLVFAREDGRFSNVVISPEGALMGWWAHQGVGVWG